LADRVVIRAPGPACARVCRLSSRRQASRSGGGSVLGASGARIAARARALDRGRRAAGAARAGAPAAGDRARFILERLARASRLFGTSLVPRGEAAESALKP